MRIVKLNLDRYSITSAFCSLHFERSNSHAFKPVGSKKDSVTTNRLDLSSPSSTQKELSSQEKCSPEMTIPNTSIKRCFLLMKTIRGVGAGAVSEIWLTPLLGGRIYFKMSEWEIHLANHQFTCTTDFMNPKVQHF